MMSKIKDFLFPKFDKPHLIRLAIIAAVAFLYFGFVCRPCFIQGESMMPTYGRNGLTFCWCPAFWFRKPKLGDIVIIRMTGNKVFLLKRIVAMEGDTVAFVDGVLHVNDIPLKETWKTLGPCDWNLPSRKVEEGCVYVVGDNRSMEMEAHVFGQIPKSRIIGVPTW